MKKALILAIAIVAVSALVGCGEGKGANAALVINETCVVSIIRIEDDAPEDETGDVAHYTITASEKFEKLNLKTVWVTSDDYRYVSFMLDNGESFIVDIKEPFSNGGDFLYKEGKKPMEFSLFQLGFDDDESSWKKIGAYFGMTWKDMKTMFEISGHSYKIHKDVPDLLFREMGNKDDGDISVTV